MGQGGKSELEGKKEIVKRWGRGVSPLFPFSHCLTPPLANSCARTQLLAGKKDI